MAKFIYGVAKTRPFKPSCSIFSFMRMFFICLFIMHYLRKVSNDTFPPTLFNSVLIPSFATVLSPIVYRFYSTKVKAFPVLPPLPVRPIL